jgi:hypothetical protein
LQGLQCLCGDGHPVKHIAQGAPVCDNHVARVQMEAGPLSSVLAAAAASASPQNVVHGNDGLALYRTGCLSADIPANKAISNVTCNSCHEQHCQHRDLHFVTTTHPSPVRGIRECTVPRLVDVHSRVITGGSSAWDCIRAPDYMACVEDGI